jgi:hypothetical protein
VPHPGKRDADEEDVLMPQVTRRAPGNITDPCAPFLPEPPGESDDALAVRAASAEGWARIEAAWGGPLTGAEREELREIVLTYLSLALAATKGPDEGTVFSRLDELAATADKLMRLLQPQPGDTAVEWETIQRVWSALDGVTIRQPQKTGHHDLWSALLSFGEVCRAARGDLEASDEFWTPNGPWQIFVSQLASFSHHRGHRPTAHKGGVGDSKVLEWRPSAFVAFVWAIQNELPPTSFQVRQSYSSGVMAFSSAVAKVLADWRAGQARA